MEEKSKEESEREQMFQTGQRLNETGLTKSQK